MKCLLAIWFDWRRVNDALGKDVATVLARDLISETTFCIISFCRVGNAKARGPPSVYGLSSRTPLPMLS